MSKKMLSKKEVAAILGKSVPTIDRLIKGNNIPYSKVGGSILFDSDLIEKWLKSTQPKKVQLKWQFLDGD